MQCKKGEITEERMKAMSIIQEACSLMLKGKTSENSMESVYLKTFINELFNGRIVSEKQLDLWRKNSRFFPKPPYRIITVNTNSSSEKNVLSYISKYFQNLFSDQMLLIQDRVLYILQYSLLPKMTQMASNELYIFCANLTPTVVSATRLKICLISEIIKYRRQTLCVSEKD